MSIDDNVLAPTLAREREAIVRFIELLELEQDALRHGKTDGLAELAARKDEVAVDLERQAGQRRSLLAANGLTTDRQGTDAWCAQHPEATDTAVWREILTLAGRARELQRVNGELIDLHLHYTAQALEVLQGSARSLDLYGPDGQSTSTGAQRINQRA